MLSGTVLTLLLFVFGILFVLIALVQFTIHVVKRKHVRQLKKLAALAGLSTGDVSYDKLEFSLRSLGWELDTLRKERVVPLSEDIFSRLTQFFSSKDGDEKEFFEQTLHFLTRHFRSHAIALVVVDGDKTRTYTQGVKGARFQSAVQKIVLAEMKRGIDKESIALSDLKTDKTLPNSLEIFGIRHSMTAPYYWQQEDGKEFSGALWFGYEETVPPTHLEQHWATEFSKRLGADFYTSQRLHQLQGQVQEVAKQSSEKDDYLAHISHDIKTPLNNIKAILQLLRLETDEKFHEFIDVALTNSVSLNELVDGVLEYTKHRAGKLVAYPEDFSLYDCAEKVTESFQVAAYRKGLILTFGGDDSLSVRADQRQVKRIITNLVSNAIKYTDSGTISVAVFQGETGPKVSVVDTGIGMSGEQLEYIFEPFTRFAERKAEGAGIGMALTKILIDLNHGEIRASSRQRHGTRFELSLPEATGQVATVQNPAQRYEAIEEVQLTAAEEQEKASVFKDFVTAANDRNKDIDETIVEEPIREDVLVQDTAPEQVPEVILESEPLTTTQEEEAEEEQLPKKLLLIDDDFDLVDSLSRMLVVKGYNVLTATNEQEAIGICNFSSPDIVVADFDMPGGGVITFLEDCIALRTIPDCIVLSGAERQIAHPNVKGVLMKPADIDELVKLIEAPKGEKDSSLVA